MSDIQASQQPQERTPRRRTAQQTLAANRRNICATSFDFLSGSFKSAARLRMASILVAGVVVILNLVIVGRGISSMITARSERSNRETVEAQYNTEVLSFGATTGLNAERNTQYLQRDEALSAALVFLVTQQRNLPQLITAALALPDVQVSSIEFNTGAGQSAPTPPSSQPGEPAAQPAGGGLTVSFTITAEAADFAVIKPWVESLKSNKNLSGVVTQREGKRVIVMGTFSGSVPTTAVDMLTELRLSLPGTPQQDPAGAGEETDPAEETDTTQNPTDAGEATTTTVQGQEGR